MFTDLFPQLKTSDEKSREQRKPFSLEQEKGLEISVRISILPDELPQKQAIQMEFVLFYCSNITQATPYSCS